MHWPFFLAVAAAIVIVGLLGLVSERLIFRRAKGNVLSGFIMSVGLVFILQVAVVKIWGVGKMKPVPAAFPEVLSIGGVSTSWQRFIVVPATVLLLGALWIFLDRFRLGRALRAAALEPEAAALQGISVQKSLGRGHVHRFRHGRRGRRPDGSHHVGSSRTWAMRWYGPPLSW